MQRTELLRIMPQAGHHLETILTDNAFPSISLPPSPQTQAGEGIKWTPLNLIHCWFTPVSSNHFALALFCINLLSQSEEEDGIVVFNGCSSRQAGIWITWFTCSSYFVWRNFDKFISSCHVRSPDYVLKCLLFLGKSCHKLFGASWKILLYNCDTLGNIRAVSLKEIPCVCEVPDASAGKRVLRGTSSVVTRLQTKRAGRQMLARCWRASLLAFQLWMPWNSLRTWQSRQCGNSAVKAVQDSAGTATL